MNRPLAVVVVIFLCGCVGQMTTTTAPGGAEWSGEGPPGVSDRTRAPGSCATPRPPPVVASRPPPHPRLTEASTRRCG